MANIEKIKEKQNKEKKDSHIVGTQVSSDGAQSIPQDDMPPDFNQSSSDKSSEL